MEVQEILGWSCKVTELEIKRTSRGNSLAELTGSIPGRGTKIPQAACPKKEKKEKKVHI